MKVMVLLNDGPAARIALEVAIRLSEQVGVASDAVVLGGPDSDILLRTAVAAGSGRAVRIDPGDVGQDLLTVSGAAAATARELGPDLILVGGREGRTGMNLLGSAMAEHLGFAHVGSTASVRIAGESVIVERRAEGVLDIIECPLPAVVSVEWGPRLRYPTLPDRLRAMRSPIEVQNGAEGVVAGTRVLRVTGPKPHRKLAKRSLPALDHVMGLLLGGVGGGGSGRRLEGEGDEVTAQIVAACLPEMEGL